ncbi:predicted nucleic acid-binding protein, containing PIN domain [Thermococcus kodakarensis KOD1]|uniref:Predicted nucleic acid-binding protein, containing PIN domain n=1 Tax=Thermococcus kodakarensis (strain ATCC BAA-918 / JCM 12380 / KOD1) TaxID=69014 RepID=Q5JDY0_THEKO|nr:type II toxin-antitoxin system VapC family toxin [Thermococcus kodakarensis]WCN28992.1 type II toxin-antitoxin system VapC family toxin [Thermococcus kodakarensis]WCN31298.1 type II toxin-antitoxin system VapC family toxin [Thermococcus kodakarensis]BAD85216.1 predicted nucleic acid-binding protein, containing PIN domain [Thermococcus kodakarensis KOD1]
MLEGERGFVIDTNVIIGAFFYNSNHPQLKQRRGILDKCRLVLALSKDKKVAVPRVAVVEVISVAKRLSGDQKFAMRLGNAVENSFEIIGEEKLSDTAKTIASAEAPSGFDTYFLALALERGYSLITRDKPMCAHADSLGVHCLLIDESTGEDDIRKFMGV